MVDYPEDMPPDPGAEFHDAIAALQQRIDELEARLAAVEERSSTLESEIGGADATERILRCRTLQVVDEDGEIVGQLKYDGEAVNLSFWNPGSSAEPRIEMHADALGGCGLRLFDGAGCESAAFGRGQDGHVRLRLGVAGGACVEAEARPAGRSDFRVHAGPASSMATFTADSSGLEACFRSATGTDRVSIMANDGDSGLYVTDGNVPRIYVESECYAADEKGAKARVSVRDSWDDTAITLEAQAHRSTMCIERDDDTVVLTEFESGSGSGPVLQVSDEEGRLRVNLEVGVRSDKAVLSMYGSERQPPLVLGYEHGEAVLPGVEAVDDAETGDAETVEGETVEGETEGDADARGDGRGA